MLDRSRFEGPKLDGSVGWVAGNQLPVAKVRGDEGLAVRCAADVGFQPERVDDRDVGVGEGKGRGGKRALREQATAATGDEARDALETLLGGADLAVVDGLQEARGGEEHRRVGCSQG